MSIFGEYRHGSMDRDEFKAAAAWEFRGENDYHNGIDHSCENCVHYVQKRVAENGTTRWVWECEYENEDKCEFEAYEE